MIFSPEFNQYIDVLHKLKPEKDSVIFNTDSKNIKPTGKRSRFRNFCSWFIYLITFTLVPRNAQLDELSRRILSDAVKINKKSILTEHEKKLYSEALGKLSLIIENNGGSLGKKVEKVLKTIAKIKALTPVVKLTENKLNSAEFPKKAAVQRTITPALIAEELQYAFVRAFPININESRAKGNYEQKVSEQSSPHEQNASLNTFTDKILLENRLSPEVIAILKENLSGDDMKLFIQNFFGFVASQFCFNGDEARRNFKFMAALNLADSFGTQNRPLILKALCHAMPTDVLIEVLRKSQSEDKIIETILARNPPEANDPDDRFFISLCERIFEAEDAPELLTKMAVYVFENESVKRKQILTDGLSVRLIIPYIKKIPSEILEDVPTSKLLEITVRVVHNFDHYFVTIDQIDYVLSFLAHALESRNHEAFLIDYIHEYASLLSFFNAEVQATLLSLILGNRMIGVELAYPNQAVGFMSKAEQLPLEVWEEASKKANHIYWDIRRLPPAQCAMVLNGQINNKEFIRSALFTFFTSVDFEKQKIFISHAKPEVFSTKDHFDPSDDVSFVNLIKILKLVDDVEKLKFLLEGPFKTDHVSRLAPGQGYLAPIFDHLEKHPWKFLLMMHDDRFNQGSLRNWITNRHFFCKGFPGFVNKYTKKEMDQLIAQLHGFFALAKDNQFAEASSVFNQIPILIRTLLLEYALDTDQEKLCGELPYLNDGQIFAIFQEPSSKTNLTVALEYGIAQNLFSNDLLDRIREIESAVNQLQQQ